MNRRLILLFIRGRNQRDVIDAGVHLRGPLHIILQLVPTEVRPILFPRGTVSRSRLVGLSHRGVELRPRGSKERSKCREGGTDDKNATLGNTENVEVWHRV
jgi:hypothetical protein